MDVREKIPVLAVVGPTASGKTALAVRLAKRFGGEIISADSMQIYSDLYVSTARPDDSEMQGVRHHLLGFLPADHPFSAADFCAMAKECAADIHARGKRVLLCGGTGLYVQSFLENVCFTGEGGDPEFRAQMHRLAQEQGNAAVWSRLHAVDPDGAAALHPNNLGRVIRALEIYRSTGLTTRQQHAQSHLEPSPYRSLVLCLDFTDRQKLYERIDLRVQDMLRRGLESEARRFFETYGSDAGTARQAIGCKEFLPYFRGEITYEQAVEAVCRGTRRYAKRQLTWFRRMPDIQTIYADAQTDVFDQAVERIESDGLFVQGG